ncbi:MAG: Cation efflux family protein [Firmicutes bacterium ADurb.Bin146]|nr:MAG: Cation efflux family protein [Firmicutes bacterium ADurb.Bin146]
MRKKTGERTLLASVIFSSPGPIVVGIGLLLGRSSTQFADFIRRTAELAAIIVSFIVFHYLNKKEEIDIYRKEKLEHTVNLTVGIALCISGIAMVFVTLFNSGVKKGNVIPGLVIALLGVVANTLFWIRYSKLSRENPDAILSVQSKLYFAKMLVDICVTLTLIVIVMAPDAKITYYIDLVGSLLVSLYLVLNGYLTIRGKIKKQI